MDIFTLLEDHAAIFFLIFSRAAGIFMVSPFFGSQNIPMLIRAGISFVIAVCIFPVIDANVEFLYNMQNVYAYALVIGKEVFVGWLIGMVAYIIMSAINMGGKVMDMQVGFAMVQVLDPTTNQQNALIGGFLYNLSIIFLVFTNGHYLILEALVASFEGVPISLASPSAGLAELMVNITFYIFLTGMKIALPVTFAILMTNVGLGILARTMPQMNIFVVGIPMQLTIGVGVLCMFVPFFILYLDVIFDAIYSNIKVALHALMPVLP